MHKCMLMLMLSCFMIYVLDRHFIKTIRGKVQMVNDTDTSVKEGNKLFVFPHANNTTSINGKGKS